MEIVGELSDESCYHFRYLELSRTEDYVKYFVEINLMFT